MSGTGQKIRTVVTQPAQQVSQTAFIFAVIAFLFLFYVTIKGDLPKWLGLFGLASGSGQSSGLISPGTNGQLASVPQATAGTNTAGAALPDVLSGNYNPPALPNIPSIGGTGQSGGSNIFGSGN